MGCPKRSIIDPRRMFTKRKTPHDEEISKSIEISRRAQLFRVFQNLLLIETFVYLLWWFIVQATDPKAYNPLSTRLIVCAYSLTLFLLSFKSAFVKRHIENLCYSSLYLLTIHFYILKYVNFENIAWPISAYITVMALCACFHSMRALLLYSLFAFAGGVYVSYLHNFMYSFYVPGLATVLFMSDMALYHRSLILKRLTEVNTKFYELFNATFEGMCLHREGIIIDANSAFCRIAGYNLEELIGKSVLDLTPTEEREEIAGRIQNNAQQTFEAWILRKNGIKIPIEISSQMHKWEGKEVKLVTVREIQERLEAEVQRRKVIQAEAELKLRDEFISIASHELKTPLTPLRLTNDLLLRATIDQKLLGYPYPKLRRLFEMTQNQINRLCRLIDDMLDVSRMNQGQLHLHLEYFNLRELIDEIRFSFAEEFERTDTKFRVHISQNVFMFLDRHRIEQVLTNLIKNAIIYAPGKKLLLYIKRYSDTVVIVLRDHGAGIAVQDHKRIFGRFERAVSAKNYGGMGLGLYITEQIVVAHKGKICVKSELGQGANFIVELPTNLTKEIEDVSQS